MAKRYAITYHFAYDRIKSQLLFAGPEASELMGAFHKHIIYEFPLVDDMISATLHADENPGRWYQGFPRMTISHTPKPHIHEDLQKSHTGTSEAHLLSENSHIRSCLATLKSETDLEVERDFGNHVPCLVYASVVVFNAVLENVDMDQLAADNSKLSWRNFDSAKYVSHSDDYALPPHVAHSVIMSGYFGSSQRGCDSWVSDVKPSGTDTLEIKDVYLHSSLLVAYIVILLSGVAMATAAQALGSNSPAFLAAGTPLSALGILIYTVFLKIMLPSWDVNDALRMVTVIKRSSQVLKPGSWLERMAVRNFKPYQFAIGVREWCDRGDLVACGSRNCWATRKAITNGFIMDEAICISSLISAGFGAGLFVLGEKQKLVATWADLGRWCGVQNVDNETLHIPEWIDGFSIGTLREKRMVIGGNSMSVSNRFSMIASLLFRMVHEVKAGMKPYSDSDTGRVLDPELEFKKEDDAERLVMPKETLTDS